MTTDTFFPADRSPSLWLRGALFGVLSFVLTSFCLELIKVSIHISSLWLPTALMTFLVFHYPARRLPVLLGGCMLGIVAANVLIVSAATETWMFPLINLFQALLGGALLRRLLDKEAPLDSLLGWSKMVVAVGIFTPLAGALFACWSMSLTGRNSFHFFTTWAISETIGMLALGPICLLWRPEELRKSFQRSTLVETLLTLVVTLALSYCALRYLPWSFTFVMVVLFYSAVRLPRLSAFIVFFATLLMMSLLLALNQLVQYTNAVSVVNNAPWLPFLLAIVPSHIMAQVMHSFQEEKKLISQSEARFRHAMEYSVIGMALVSPEGRFLQVNQSLCRLLGYTRAELVTMNFQTLTHPDDLTIDESKRQDLLAGKIETYSHEKRYLHKDGRVVWALLAASLVLDSERRPLYFISQVEDISDLKKTEAANRRLMQRITLANEAGGIGVWDLNLQTGKMAWDKRMFQLYGLNEEGQATYLTWVNSLLPADRQMAIDAFDRGIKHSLPVDIVFRIATNEGIRFIHSQSKLVFGDDGQVERMLGINQDVTTMRQLTDALYQEKERMHITLDAIGEAVISTDEEMCVTFMNPVAEVMSGWTQEEAAGKPLSDLLRITHGSDGPKMENLLSCELPHSKSVPELDEELMLHNRSGECFDIQYSITPLKTLEGDYIGSVMVIQDVSESREMMRRLSYGASHDMLTRLPNRVSFEQRLKQLLHSACQQQRLHTLIFIDLDRFKAVNDNAGHAAGDALLREISGQMKQHLRGGDFLARLGGDEFGALLPDCLPDEARDLAERLVAAVNHYPFLWEGQLYRIGASAGLTQLSKDNAHASDVMAQADLACYNAKHNGRGQFSVYEAKLLDTLKPVMSQRENAQILPRASDQTGS
ncbi:MAG TPA: diguanylate cyclase [Erwinia sp.]|uniref:diguanylate cyclase n=1 Tax=Erwinia citreus TaxID=558 RepID=UPI000E838642|nr:diguanylate cyclase [Erwinia sp.]HBV40391.1 diguanylate cyclase [Erwinia sp.]